MYYLFQVWEDEGDKRTAHYPFMSGPWSTLMAVLGYLYFVKIYGPRLMKDRPPFVLKDLMVAYNFLMVLLSGWMFFEGCIFLNFGLDTWGCAKNDYADDSATKRFHFIAWLFFFSKLVEFTDTIFMVLRKKFNQISNLHVIHHSIVPLSVWLGIKFAPSGSNAWFPLLNSFVHTIMYFYFGLMALGDSLPPQRIAQLRFYKPWITRLQIAQFCVAILHCIVAAVQTNCHFPRTFFALNLGNAVLFLALFFNFYRKCYSASQEKEKGCREVLHVKELMSTMKEKVA